VTPDILEAAFLTEMNSLCGAREAAALASVLEHAKHNQAAKVALNRLVELIKAMTGDQQLGAIVLLSYQLLPMDSYDESNLVRIQTDIAEACGLKAGHKGEVLYIHRQ